MQEIFLQVWNNPDRFALGRGSLGRLACRRRTQPHPSIFCVSGGPPSPATKLSCPLATNLASEVERNTMMAKVRGILRRAALAEIPPSSKSDCCSLLPLALHGAGGFFAFGGR